MDRVDPDYSRVFPAVFFVERRFCVVPTHFRFLMNIKLSFWQTYSNPTSMSALISSGLSTTFTVKTSSYLSNSVCSMLM